MLVKISKSLKQKGQGIVEYALLLAFVVGIGMMLNGSNLGGSIKGTFEGVADYLKGYVTASKNYPYYFDQLGWRKYKSDELSDIPQEDRLKADQEGLALIASLFLEKSVEDVNNLMNRYTNKWGDENMWVRKNLDQSRMGPVNDGWSEIMVPLSYWNSDFDVDYDIEHPANGGYYWLECSSNANLIKDMSGLNKVDAGKNQVNYNNRAGTKDRVFYSNEMIGADSKDRAVAMKVHYNEGKVDKVWIAAQQGTKELGKGKDGKDIKIEGNYSKSPGYSAWSGEAESIKGLDITVTGPANNYKYKVNN